MRKKPDINPRPCERCGKIYKPTGTVQKHCPDCKIIVSKETKRRWYEKTYPDRKPIEIARYKSEFCCICGKPFASSFKGEPYCNVHYLRMYNYGSPWARDRKHGNPYEVNGDVVTMTTHDDRTFTIDKSDLNKVLRYTWCYSKTGYLVANIDHKTTKLTRYLLNPPNDKVVDHINGDPSDNRRCNLRICTNKENARNARKPINSKNKYAGVSETKHGTYNAHIMYNRKSINLGTYKTEEEAYKVRLEAERKYFGEFSRNNQTRTNDDNRGNEDKIHT